MATLRHDSTFRLENNSHPITIAGLVDSFLRNKSKVNMKSLFAFFICLFSIALVSAAAAQDGSGVRSAGEPALPYIPSLDVSAMDKTIDPCVDLYHYSCGGW